MLSGFISGNDNHIFGGFIELYHACKWYLSKNTGFEIRQISLAYRLGKFVSQAVFFGKYHIQTWYISIKFKVQCT
jgi:hypothetical protein